MGFSTLWTYIFNVCITYCQATVIYLVAVHIYFSLLSFLLSVMSSQLFFPFSLFFPFHFLLFILDPIYSKKSLKDEKQRNQTNRENYNHIYSEEEGCGCPGSIQDQIQPEQGF